MEGKKWEMIEWRGIEHDCEKTVGLELYTVQSIFIVTLYYIPLENTCFIVYDWCH